MMTSFRDLHQTKSFKTVKMLSCTLSRKTHYNALDHFGEFQFYLGTGGRTERAEISAQQGRKVWILH